MIRLSIHLGLGLAWIALLASRAAEARGAGASAATVFVRLLLAGWLPSLALACWQVQRRKWLDHTPAPAPLPLLGAGVALGDSRRLRRRISR